MTSGTVLFDFDDTLTTTDTTKFLFCSLLLHRPYRIGDVVKFYCGKNRDKQVMQSEKCRCTGSLIKGHSAETGTATMSLFRKLVTAKFRTSMVERMNCYRNDGYQVVIATASPTFAVNDLFDKSIIVLGTEYEIQNGRFTGALSGAPCFGEYKAERVRKYLLNNSLPAIEAAFSDDVSDEPFLRLAKHGYIVAKNGNVSEYPAGCRLQ